MIKNEMIYDALDLIEEIENVSDKVKRNLLKNTMNWKCF